MPMNMTSQYRGAAPTPEWFSGAGSRGTRPAPTGISTLALIARGVTLRGISAMDHRDAMPAYLREFGRAPREGALVYPYTRLTGIGQAPRALCELVAGRHLGAVLVEP